MRFTQTYSAAACHNIHYTLDVAGAQDIVLADFGETFGGIHNQHIRVVPFLLQDHDDSGDIRSWSRHFTTLPRKPV